MGGPGSGSYCRWNKKTCADELINIDIRHMNRSGRLQPGTGGLLSWSRYGESMGSVSYTVFDDRMFLIYRYRRCDKEWEDVKDTIELNKTPCNFGGFRHWLICPSCSRRVAVLYGPGKYFHCRKCYGLSYASQSEGKLDRLCRKARKIRRKLAIDNHWWNPDALGDPIFMKPKGMRWPTFERLQRAENQAQDEIDQLFRKRFGQGWY